MKKLLYAILCLIISCNNDKNHQEKFENIQSNRNIIFNQSIIDSCQRICLDSVSASYVGRILFKNNKFYFVDEKFCRIYIFDENGKFLKFHLGKGKSNQEVDGGYITGYVTLQDGSNCVISSIRCLLYDSLFSRTKAFVLNSNDSNEISASNPTIYTMCYENFVLKTHKNYIFYNMTLQHPKYNFIENPTLFYEQSRVLFVTDYQTNKFVKMLGKYSDVYSGGKHNQFSLTNFDVNDEGHIYLSYEADEKIYVYDDKFNPTIRFGVKGEDMNTDYPALKTYEDFKNEYSSHRDTYSYYKDIQFINELNYIARIYVKHSTECDGLQLYNKERELIADLNIPKNYKIAGSDSNHIYLYFADDFDENIDILKINLKSNVQ